MVIVIYLIRVYYRNLMCFNRVVHFNVSQLIIDQSLAAGFIPINTGQQRASLPFKPGVLERKVHAYNNDDKIFFSVLKFAKPSRFGLQHITLCLGKR